MKKTLLALAVIGFAGAASAQSSVTMYGRVDLSVGKPIGTAQKGMFNGSGSRLGMRGVEDLGGGLKGLFNIEHRFNADTGSSQNFGAASAANNRFWGARSIVGVSGGFGEVVLGREYTVPFLASQLAADPWGWDTIAAGVTATITGGAIAAVRNDSSLTYKVGFSGVTLGFQTAERTDQINNFSKRPVNFAVGYAGGPVQGSIGHEVVGNGGKWTTGQVAVAFGPFKPGVFIGSGTAASGAKHKAWMVTGVGTFGPGELRVAAGKLTAKSGGISTGVVNAIALGYHHSLSKRTTVYADFARNSKAATDKTGYDVGLKHNF